MKFVIKLIIALYFLNVITSIKIMNKNDCDTPKKTVLGREYTCIKQLGSGNQGTVYLVKDSSGKEYAYKQTNEIDLEIVKHNYEIYSAYKKLNSKYVMKVYECAMKKGGKDEDGKRLGYLKLLLEPINGPILYNYTFTSGTDLLTKYLMLIKGLIDLDKGRILHNDIKSDNIMVDLPTGNLKIIDFDNSKLFSKSPEEISELLKDTTLQQMRESIYNFLSTKFSKIPTYDFRLNPQSDSQKIIKKITTDNSFQSFPGLSDFTFSPEEFNCMKFIIRSSLSSQNYFREPTFQTSFINEQVPVSLRNIFENKKKK